MKRLYTDFSKFLSEATDDLPEKDVLNFVGPMVNYEKSFLWETFLVEEHGPDHVHKGIDEGNVSDFETCMKEVKKYADLQQKQYEHLVDGGDVMGVVHLSNFIVDAAYRGVHIFVVYYAKKKEWAVKIDSFIVDFL